MIEEIVGGVSILLFVWLLAAVYLAIRIHMTGDST